ncbi:hypothetical protein ACLOJK_020752 [Asimina triloba]
MITTNRGDVDLVGGATDLTRSKEEGTDNDEFCSLGSRMVRIWHDDDNILVGTTLLSTWPKQSLRRTVIDEWV